MWKYYALGIHHLMSPGFGCINQSAFLELQAFMVPAIFFFRGLNLSSGKVTVNFEHMSMQIDSSAQFLLRRRSTPSYIQEPENVLSTKWVWYWKDDDGWKKYAKTKVDTIPLLHFESRIKHLKLLRYHEICTTDTNIF